MATHSSILAWRIPWTEEPGGQRVGHSGGNLAQHVSNTSGSLLDGRHSARC